MEGIVISVNARPYWFIAGVNDVEVVHVHSRGAHINGTWYKLSYFIIVTMMNKYVEKDLEREMTSTITSNGDNNCT